VQISRWLGVGAVFGSAALSACANDSAGVESPTSAQQLAFTVQPSNTTVGAAIAPAVQVTIEDAAGTPVTNGTGNITVAIGRNPNVAILSGIATVAAVNGVATFSTLSLSQAGIGYTLTASIASLPVATSSAFNVTAAAASAH
jgi:hypothetical protein